MEINITELVSRSSFDPYQLSNSIANLGDNAGQITWRNSVEVAKESPQPLQTEEQKEAFRDFVKDSGGWDKEEIAAWDDNELNALFVQWVAGDIREGFGDDLSDNIAEWDWKQYEIDSEKGRVSSRLFYNDKDNSLYFYIGN